MMLSSASAMLCIPAVLSFCCITLVAHLARPDLNVMTAMMSMYLAGSTRRLFATGYASLGVAMGLLAFAILTSPQSGIVEISTATCFFCSGLSLLPVVLSARKHVGETDSRLPWVIKAHRVFSNLAFLSFIFGMSIYTIALFIDSSTTVHMIMLVLSISACIIFTVINGREIKNSGLLQKILVTLIVCWIFFAAFTLIFQMS